MIDPILASVFARAFKSITDEMSISLQRTTRSPILCEAKDFVTGLYDAEGRMLEQTENLPILSFSLAPVCKHIRNYFVDDERMDRLAGARVEELERRLLALRPEPVLPEAPHGGQHRVEGASRPAAIRVAGVSRCRDSGAADRTRTSRLESGRKRF